MMDTNTLGYSGWRGLKNLGELASGLTLLLLTGSETMLFELGDEGSVYDVSVYSDHSRQSST